MFTMKKLSPRRRSNSRRLLMESLEDRRLLAADCVVPWHDSNLDEYVSTADMVLVVSTLYLEGGAHPHNPMSTDRWLDVDFDGWVTPRDALEIFGDLQVNGGHPFVLECPTEEVGTLSVVQKALPLYDVVVANANNVPLLSFEATTDDVEDLLLTSASFVASIGTMNDVEQLQLWADTDNNNVVDTIIAESRHERIDAIFGEGYIISQSFTVRFEVRGDMASSFTGSQFQLAFDPSNPVTVEALDDGGPAEWTVNPTDSTVFDLREQGDLFVTRDSTPVRSHQVLGGEVSDALLRIEVCADYEDIDVTYIGVDVEGDFQSIDRLEAVVDGVVIAYGTRAAALPGDDFGFRMQSRQFVVGEGTEDDVVIRAQMKSDNAGGVSGEEFALAVDAVFARGDISSNNLMSNDGDSVAEREVFIGVSTPMANEVIRGPEHTVVMAKHEAIENANADPNGTAVGVGIGSDAEWRFTGKRNVNSRNGLEKIVHDKVVALYESGNVEYASNGFGWLSKSDESFASTNYHLERTDGTVITTPTVSGTFRVVFTGLRSSIVNTEIGSGESRTFVLQRNILNSSIDPTEGSFVQVSLLTEELVWHAVDAVHSQEIIGAGSTAIPSTLYRL